MHSARSRGLGSVLVAWALVASCSGDSPPDLSLVRFFYTSDALGYLEPCG